MKKSYILLLLLLAILSCQKVPDPELKIPTEVQPYIDSFVAEAKKRGIDIKIDNLIVEFGNTNGDFVCALCQFPTAKQRYIVINKDPDCWKNAYEQARESLVYHELGHCYLSRSHKTDKFANGIYKSLMNPDNVETYSTCRYPLGGDVCDKRPRRQYYIDELFDENTPTPVWGK
jgi:hypothetical protein